MHLNANSSQIFANSGLVYPELSYKIMGILFKVHNELGQHLQEKYYQRAVEIELSTNKIKFEKEKMIPLKYEGKTIGKYYLDFLIENKVILEFKTIDFFTKKDWKQVISYLKTTGIRLGILVNFNCEKLIYKRVLNPFAPIRE